MNCPNCQTLNEKDNLFCVGCGGHLAPSQTGKRPLPPTLPGLDDPPPTQIYTPNQSFDRRPTADSIPTVFQTTPQYTPSMQNFTPLNAYTGAQPVQRGGSKFIWLGALVLLVLLGGGIGAFYVINKQSAGAEILPDHLGMFVQNKEKNGISEISKQDTANAVAAKDELLKSESLTTVEGKPNLILYADGKDISLNDLKLVPLDTIKDDGSLKQINYQAAPVEGKPEMKRLRVPDGLANGKYAFALFDGFLDEGKHKLWAFQVRNADKNDNGDLAKALTLNVKPKPSPSPPTAGKQPGISPPIVPSVPPPSGASVVYCNNSSVILRAGPSQFSAKLGNLGSGQRLYVLGYSDEYEYFTSSKTGKTLYSNYVRVQTDSGKQGWVYRAFTR